MGQFNNAYQSHEHSLTTLNLIRHYDDFMDSVSSVADFGCGGGLDIEWWAKQESAGNEEDPPRPYNYKCYAIDRDLKQLRVELPKNVHTIEADFESRVLLPTPVDVIWCHNAFQYCINPMNTLKLFNQQLVENGMLYICMPVHRNTEHGRIVNRSASYQYFEYTLQNLIYMLAVNGFDCRDAYFLKEASDPWVHAVVYKSGVEPMDPRTTSWYDIAKKKLLNPAMENSIGKTGYLTQEDMIFGWLDKNWHYARD